MNKANNFLLFVFGLSLVGMIGCARIDLDLEMSRPLCNDDFNRTESGNLGEQWMPDFGGFNTGAVIFKIKDQKMYNYLPNQAFVYALCANRVEQKKSVFSERLSLSQFSNLAAAMIGARVQWKYTLNDGMFCGIYEQRLTLFRSVNGLQVILSQTPAASIPIATPITYDIKFSIDANRFNCSIAGSVNYELSATDDTFASGYTGFFNHAASGGAIELAIDDFKTEVKP